MNSFATAYNIPGSFITNGQGQLLHMSSNLNEWLGYSPAELIGDSFVKIFTKESGQELLSRHLNSVVSGAEQTDEYHLLHKNGYIIPVCINAVSIANADGNAIRIFTLNKMTANKEDSTPAEMGLALLLNHTEECFVLVDTNLTIIRFNKQFFSLYKKYLGKEIFIGNNILDYSTFSQRERLNELYLKVLQGATIETEIEIPRENEKPVFFYLKYKPVRDNSGIVIGVFVSGADITEKIISQQALLQKQLELEQAETNYREIFEKANEGICVYDINSGLVVEANNKACELVGCSKEVFLVSSRKEYEANLPRFNIGIALQKFKKAVDGEPQLFEWLITRSDHVHSWMEVSLTSASIAGSQRVLAFFRDINDRKKAEQEKEFEKIDKEALINSTGDLIWSLSKDFNLIAANEAFIEKMKKTIGYRLKAGDNLLLRKNFPQDFLNFWEHLYKKAFSGENFTEEIYSPASGYLPEFWLEVSFNPVVQNDEIVFIACYGRDISQNKRYQQQLQLANEKLEISQQVAKLGLWELDLTTNEMYCSDETYRIFGLQKKEVTDVFKTLVGIIHPQDRELFDTEFRYALIGEKLLNVENRIITSTGLVKTVIQRGSVIYDAANHPARFSGTIQDITERKYMEEQLWASQRQLDLIYNTVNEIIFLVDIEEGNRFRFQSVNKSFLNSTGLQKEQVLNKYIEDVIPANSYPIVLENYLKALETGKSVSWEETSQYPTGEKTGIVTVTPILNDNGKCLQLIGSIHDITALKISGDKMEKLNAQLKEQAMALAESNLELERFAYVASHDLQEPLRMVSSFLQLLEKKYKGRLDETGSKYIYYAVDGSDRMQKLILDLLEYSRVNTNNDAIGDTDMNAVTKEILHIMDNKVKELNAIVETGPLPVLAGTRRTQMFQLMQNLVSNAFKYHGANRLHISIKAVEEHNKWIFSIEDNGIGFDEAFAEKVFVIFQRLHNKSEYNGTGIGLSICKKIVERYNGKIWVNTAPGKGSCFYFSISK